ncbi:MAG: cytochrome P450 [bacterium]
MATPLRPPGPSGPLLLQVFLALRDPLAYLEGLRDRYGEIVMVRRDKTYLLCSPDGVKRVLQDNHLNYIKGPLYRKGARPLMGDGLFTADGEAWKQQRRIAQPAFSRSLHDDFAALINREVQVVRDRWMAKAQAGQSIDLHPELVWATLRFALRLVFGEDVDARVDELTGAFLKAQKEINLLSVFNPLNPPEWVPTPSRHRFRAGKRVLHEFVLETIARRRASSERGSDLLSLYLKAAEQEDGPLDIPLLRDEMMTLLATGHDVTCDAITWTLYFLMKHPDVEQRLTGVIHQTLGGRVPTLADLAAMPYLSWVINEAMRINPPAWGMLRTAVGPDTLCGYPIAPGARVIVSPYVVHRNPRVWDRPLEFEPDRFDPERMKGKHRFVFFPFGAGPRQCIGMGVAIIEAQLFLASFLSTFRFEIEPGQDIRPLPRVSLKPNGPIRTRLHRRQARS